MENRPHPHNVVPISNHVRSGKHKYENLDSGDKLSVCGGGNILDKGSETEVDILPQRLHNSSNQELAVEIILRAVQHIQALGFDLHKRYSLGMGNGTEWRPIRIQSRMAGSIMVLPVK